MSQATAFRAKFVSSARVGGCHPAGDGVTERTMGKVLVTGASGFVGSRLVRALVERGETVRVLVRPGSSLRGLKELPQDRVEVCIGDIMIEHEVYRALAGCDRMFHVAAVYKMYAPNPKDILEPAILGTEASLDAARKRGIEKVVVTSSVAAVGVNDRPEPMDEGWDFNLKDSETYVVAKWKAEQVALSFVDRGLPVVVVNPAGIFGPGDWKPTPSGDTILKYLKWSYPWGFPTSDGGINVVDVDDVVAGHLGAMDKGRVGERYILGGENVTFEQMFRLLSELTGLVGPGMKASPGLARAMGWSLELGARLFGGEPPLTYKMARDYVGRYVWVSSDKAGKELGYAPRPARQTLLRSVKWYLYNGYLEEREEGRLLLDVRG